MDLYHLDIFGADMVFGMAWLKSLGRVLTDYNLLTMEFDYQGQSIILYVDKLLKETLINGHCMKKLLATDNVSSFYQLHISSSEQHHTAPVIPADVQ